MSDEQQNVDDPVQNVEETTENADAEQADPVPVDVDTSAIATLTEPGVQNLK